MSEFIKNLKNTIDSAQDNVSITENGAVGYKTTGKALLDLNFALASLRNKSEDEIWKLFLSAYNENPDLAVTWMFFCRDPRGGSGERRTFRVIYPRLVSENPELAIKLMKFIPEYGRWDDLIDILYHCSNRRFHQAACEMIADQFHRDLADLKADKPVSLLGKWLPSENTSSRETRARAKMIRFSIGFNPKQYRKALSALRRQIDVVERKMSANEWSSINYSGVPSKAMMNYRKAFCEHDNEGFSAYLDAVKQGTAKIHSGTLFPYEIYHAYTRENRFGCDETLEEQWKALPNYVPEGSGGTLVVVDGSGSMFCTIANNSSVRAIDVSRSLGIYFAEKLSGPFADSFITFSSRPELVTFRPGISLRSRMDITEEHNDCSNTDIKKTFDLILRAAVRGHCKQEEMPENVLIISDMEFDSCFDQYDYHLRQYVPSIDQALFEIIRRDFESAGYKLPRLVFWNVCSRTGTIPLTENELGVALVSGFSPSIADMVLSGRLNPWDCLVDKLTSERYAPILNEVRSLYER